MADRYGRTRTLQICAVVAAATTLLLPLVIGQGLLVAPVLFIAGGTISGIYTLGVILIGQDFRGQRLAVVSTGFAMAYSAGSIVGSTPIGFAIDLSARTRFPSPSPSASLASPCICSWRRPTAGEAGPAPA